MASLTVRQLDDKLKRQLRLRAARNGRSMEDEIRVILRAAAQDAGRDMRGAFRGADAAFASGRARAGGQHARPAHHRRRNCRL